MRKEEKRLIRQLQKKLVKDQELMKFPGPKLSRQVNWLKSPRPQPSLPSPAILGKAKNFKNRNGNLKALP